jgi:NAD(P)-dependent dehydrogenase (short-subunit alcohol dehydrogenase family)
VNALSNTAARELGPRGIRVNIISPGFIRTIDRPHAACLPRRAPEFSLTHITQLPT